MRNYEISNHVQSLQMVVTSLVRFFQVVLSSALVDGLLGHKAQLVTYFIGELISIFSMP
jgi:hypothetical protein